MFQVRRVMTRSLAAAAMVTAIGVSAEAEPIPQDWLNNIRTGCIDACRQAQFSAQSCETACTCVAQQTAASISKEELMAANAANAQKQPPPPAIAAKTEAIQDRCAPAQ